MAKRDPKAPHRSLPSRPRDIAPIRGASPERQHSSASRPRSNGSRPACRPPRPRRGGRLLVASGRTAACPGPESQSRRDVAAQGHRSHARRAGREHRALRARAAGQQRAAVGRARHGQIVAGQGRARVGQCHMDEGEVRINNEMTAEQHRRPLFTYAHENGRCAIAVACEPVARAQGRSPGTTCSPTTAPARSSPCRSRRAERTSPPATR